MLRGENDSKQSDEFQAKRKRDRERRCNLIDEQCQKNARGSRKEIEKGGAILLMSNARESKKEKGKGDKISLKSNWRMNEREQEKIDAELATSGEERSEKQQSKNGVN